MLIGSYVVCKDTGAEGVVLDETKNTLLIDVGGSKKRILKDNKRFIVKSHNKVIKIRGNDIKMRPWEYAI